MTSSPANPDRYAVFGNPIAHSKSPMIHALFAEQTKQNIEYTKPPVELGQFEQAAKKFFDEGGKGLNVTVPFKLDAFAFAEKNGSVSERAKLAGAVNTLKKLDDGKIFGDNTDGIGLVRDITQNLGWEIKGKNILILGAGGAARGVLCSLLTEQPKEILIANRTREKAEELKKISDQWGRVSILSINDEIPDTKIGLVINGTSTGIQNTERKIPDILLRFTNKDITSETYSYDMTYGVKGLMFNTTPFLLAIWQHILKEQVASPNQNPHMADGLGMLVEQAAESFYIWRGVRPQTKPVIDEVRREL
jgi:shikimate dehydrogenase